MMENNLLEPWSPQERPVKQCHTSESEGEESWEKVINICEKDIYNLKELQNRIDSQKKSDDRTQIWLSLLGVVSGLVFLIAIFAQVSVQILFAGAVGYLVSGGGSFVHNQTKRQFEAKALHCIESVIKELEDILKGINKGTRIDMENILALRCKCQNLHESVNYWSALLQFAHIALGVSQFQHLPGVPEQMTLLPSHMIFAAAVELVTIIQLLNTIDGTLSKHKLSEAIDLVIKGIKYERTKFELAKKNKQNDGCTIM